MINEVDIKDTTPFNQIMQFGDFKLTNEGIFYDGHKKYEYFIKANQVEEREIQETEKKRFAVYNKDFTIYRNEKSACRALRVKSDKAICLKESNTEGVLKDNYINQYKVIIVDNNGQVLNEYDRIIDIDKTEKYIFLLLLNETEDYWEIVRI
jgi:hypothetical protein